MSKPKFDPNKPFEVADSKPKFDPNKPFEAAPEPDSGNPLTAFGEGAADTATFGWLNNIRGATEPLVFGALNKLTGENVEADDYIQARDGYEKRTARLKEENPNAYLGGQVAGGIAQALALAPIATANGLTAADRIRKAAMIGGAMGAAQNPGNVEGKESYDLAQTGKNIAMGVGLGAGFQGLGEVASKAAKIIPSQMKKSAEQLAENATGATRVQSEKFADNAGRELLDRKMVRFGDNAESIANRTGEAVKNAEDVIDSSLKALDAKGVTASADNVVSEIQKQISALEKDPSQASVVRQLKGIVDDIIETGESNILLSEAEQTKRGFNKIAKNWQDPEKGQAGKIAYRAYRDEVERAAQNAAPEIADQFKGAKKDFGLFTPIQDAAEKRAATLNQSPFGGLLDMATAGGGGVMGGPIGSAAAMAGRRFVAPRLASSGAVTLDAVSKQLMKMSPKFSKLAQENPAAFAAMVENFAGRTEFKENQNSESTPQIENQDRIIEILGQNPQLLNSIQNPELRKQLELKLQQKTRSGDAKKNFIEEN